MRHRFKAAIIVACLSAPAFAVETIKFTYDVQGRVAQAAHSGTVNTGVSSSYAYDPADNRTNVSVSLPPPPSSAIFTIGAATAGPGSVLQFAIYDGGPLSAATSVAYSTINGTGLNGGVSGKDYVAVSGTLTFQPGDTQKLVSVQSLVNSAKTSSSFRLQLSSPSAGSVIVSPGYGTGSIGTGRCTAPCVSP